VRTSSFKGVTGSGSGPGNLNRGVVLVLYPTWCYSLPKGIVAHTGGLERATGVSTHASFQKQIPWKGYRFMAMSLAATTYVHRLIAVLFGLALTTSVAVAESTTKGTETVRVVTDQMHQLQVVKVEPHAFRVQRSAIGQIAFNEDASTTVLTPFSGRVTV